MILLHYLPKFDRQHDKNAISTDFQNVTDRVGLPIP